MNVDELIVITYPRHILITGIVVREAIRFQDWDKPITIIYDDLFEPSYTTYVDDLKWTLERSNPNTVFNFIPFSTFEFLTNKYFIQDPMRLGWIRQQFIKLYLDEMLCTDTWFVMDSDCILTSTIEPNTIPYSTDLGVDIIGEKFQNYWDFMYQQPIKHDVFTHANPFRFLDRELLVGLKHHIEQLHGMSFTDIHMPLLKNGIISCEMDNMIMSEWDLIEYYRANIIKQPMNMITVGLHILPYDNIVEGIYVSTIYGQDSDLGKKWFSDNGIIISDTEFKGIVRNWMQSEREPTEGFSEISNAMQSWNKSYI